MVRFQGSWARINIRNYKLQRECANNRVALDDIFKNLDIAATVTDYESSLYKNRIVLNSHVYK